MEQLTDELINNDLYQLGVSVDGSMFMLLAIGIFCLIVSIYIAYAKKNNTKDVIKTIVSGIIIFLISLVSVSQKKFNNKNEYTSQVWHIQIESIDNLREKDISSINDSSPSYQYYIKMHGYNEEFIISKQTYRKLKSTMINGQYPDIYVVVGSNNKPFLYYSTQYYNYIGNKLLE